MIPLIQREIYHATYGQWLRPADRAGGGGATSGSAVTCFAPPPSHPHHYTILRNGCEPEAAARPLQRGDLLERQRRLLAHVTNTPYCCACARPFRRKRSQHLRAMAAPGSGRPSRWRRCSLWQRGDLLERQRRLIARVRSVKRSARKRYAQP